MNPIITQQLNAAIDIAALTTYLESIGSNINEFIIELDDMNEEDLQKFMANYAIYQEETKNAVVSKISDLSNNI